MTISVLYEEHLEYVGGGSDKLYVIRITEEAGTFKTTCYYGRRGASLSVSEKYVGSGSGPAFAAANKVSSEKTRKGYTPFVGSVPGLPAIAGAGAATSTGPATPATPKTPAPDSLGLPLAEAEDPDQFMARGDLANWCAQRKYDGERRPIRLSRERGVIGYNRTSNEVPLSALVESTLGKLLSHTSFSKGAALLDGEIMGDVYIAYDLLELGGRSVRERPFEERYALLEELLDSATSLLAPVAWTPEDMAELLATAKAQKWEGLYARLMAEPVSVGRSFDQLKLKLWESATCLVLKHNASRSVAIGLLDSSGAIVPKGNVTIGGSIEMPPPYSFIEVKYLYCHEGGDLYQPSYLGPRTDKSAPDTVASLKLPPPEKR